ncbi:hypothetical protein ACCC84_21920 [Serratia odorifera]|uniref:hypothetical protein n=1 Tax=Serratia odorifera TaxID=618 RepID=UPI003531899E
MIIELEKQRFVSSLVNLTDKVSSKSFSGSSKEQEQALLDFFKESNERFAIATHKNVHI